MRVVCKINSLNSLNSLNSQELLGRLKKYINIPGGEIGLAIGKEYTVYGILFRDNSPWYYLCEENHDSYPIPFAAEFFDVVDHKHSRYWYQLVAKKWKDQTLKELVFKEWVSDKSYYERLVDGDAKAVELFKKISGANGRGMIAPIGEKKGKGVDMGVVNKEYTGRFGDSPKTEWLLTDVVAKTRFVRRACLEKVCSYNYDFF